MGLIVGDLGIAARRGQRTSTTIPGGLSTTSTVATGGWFPEKDSDDDNEQMDIGVGPNSRGSGGDDGDCALSLAQ